MTAKDHKREENLLKGNLYDIHPRGLQDEMSMDGYADQKEGIVRIIRDSRKDSDEEFHTMQEQHNANHALYFFNRLAEGLIDGQSTGNDWRKVARAKEHMMNLREFLGDDKAGLKGVIETLLGKLETFCPAHRKEFAQLLLENWSLLRFFAQAYLKKEQRCLTEEQQKKLKDILSGRWYLKLWWWRSRSKKLRMRFVKFIREVKP